MAKFSIITLPVAPRCCWDHPPTILHRDTIGARSQRRGGPKPTSSPGRIEAFASKVASLSAPIARGPLGPRRPPEHS